MFKVQHHYLPVRRILYLLSGLTYLPAGLHHIHSRLRAVLVVFAVIVMLYSRRSSYVLWHLKVWLVCIYMLYRYLGMPIHNICTCVLCNDINSTIIYHRPFMLSATCEYAQIVSVAFFSHVLT